MNWITEDLPHAVTVERATISDLRLTVCLDDEGPLTPCHYVEVHRGVTLLFDGWAASPDAGMMLAILQACDLLRLDLCGARSELGFGCTDPQGHDGQHCARQADGQICEEWA